MLKPSVSKTKQKVILISRDESFIASVWESTQSSCFGKKCGCDTETRIIFERIKDYKFEKDYHFQSFIMCAFVFVKRLSIEFHN